MCSSASSLFRLALPNMVFRSSKTIKRILTKEACGLVQEKEPSRTSPLHLRLLGHYLSQIREHLKRNRRPSVCFVKDLPAGLQLFLLRCTSYVHCETYWLTKLTILVCCTVDVISSKTASQYAGCQSCSRGSRSIR